MAEDFQPAEEGRRIAAAYLSKRTLAKEWRRTLNREVYAAFQREELEAKQRQCDQIEEEAEEVFSREVDRWRQDSSPQAKQALTKIVEMLGTRNDLGFFGQRIVERLKRELF